MEWQWALVGLCVALAVAYLARRTWRTWRGRAAGCGGCKCPAPPARQGETLIPAEQLTLRTRNSR